MWIYFVEQVWCYDNDKWSQLGWTTHECSARTWDHWHLRAYPDENDHRPFVYPAIHMVESEDYVDF